MRRAFLEAQLSTRITKAIAHSTRQETPVNFQKDDSVFILELASSSRYAGSDWQCFIGKKFHPSRREGRGDEYRRSKGLFDKADAAEVEKLTMMNAFKRVDPASMTAEVEVLGSRFVRTWKQQDGAADKAASRLVVQGHQESMADENEEWIDSPSGTRESLKMMLAEAARRKWSVWGSDVARAFLQCFQVISEETNCNQTSKGAGRNNAVVAAAGPLRSAGGSSSVVEHVQANPYRAGLRCKQERPSFLLAENKWGVERDAAHTCG